MKGAIAVAMCALGSVPAAAQYNTNCQSYGNTTNCQTSAPAPGVDWNGYFQRQQEINQQNWANVARALQERQEAKRRAEAEQAADAHAAGVRWERQQIGRMVADGECDRAKNEALSYGDFDLAQQAVALCKPAPKPVPAPAAVGPREDTDALKIAALISAGKCHEAATYAGVMNRPDLVALASNCKPVAN